MPSVSFAPSNFLMGSISGTVAKDTNNDGSGDLALAGVTVTLFDAAGLNEIDSTITDSNGSYTFFNLPLGSYVVKETNLPGFVDVSDHSGDMLDSTATVLLGSGENKVIQDFVNEQLSTISGEVFDSFNIPLAGVTVTLYDATRQNVMTTTVTGSNGTYLFLNLPPGTYYVKETNLAGYVDVSDTQGDTKDSTIQVSLAGGIISAGNNFFDERSMSCGTGYGFLLQSSTCFTSLGTNKWGWVVDLTLLTVNSSSTLDLYVGAAKCIIKKRSPSGTVKVLRTGTEEVTITFMITEPSSQFLTATHVYVGPKDQRPDLSAPGRYGSTKTYVPPSDTSTHILKYRIGDQFIVHAEVCSYA